MPACLQVLRSPSSPETQPSSSPGAKSMPWAPARSGRPVALDLGCRRGLGRRVAVHRVVVEHAQDLCHDKTSPRSMFARRPRITGRAKCTLSAERRTSGCGARAVRRLAPPMEFRSISAGGTAVRHLAGGRGNKRSCSCMGSPTLPTHGRRSRERSSTRVVASPFRGCADTTPTRSLRGDAMTLETLWPRRSGAAGCDRRRASGACRP